jgi:hypothetical protein
MITAWDETILTTILATHPSQDHDEIIKDLVMKLIREGLGMENNDYFNHEAMVIQSISGSDFLDEVLICGRRHPRFDNGDNANHSHLLRMYMHKRFDLEYSLIQQNVSNVCENLKLPISEVPSDFDWKTPILLVGSNHMIIHIFARELRLRYREATGNQINDIYVTRMSMYERLMDISEAFNLESKKTYQKKVVLVQFGVSGKFPSAVKLFDEYVMPNILKLAKKTLVILMSDEPWVLKHYSDHNLLTINLDTR